jgi:hypothetical protein
MKSPRHRFNILYSSYRDVGIGFPHGAPFGPADRSGTYTVDFGYRRG